MKGVAASPWPNCPNAFSKPLSNTRLLAHRDTFVGPAADGPWAIPASAGRPPVAASSRPVAPPTRSL